MSTLTRKPLFLRIFRTCHSGNLHLTCNIPPHYNEKMRRRSCATSRRLSHGGSQNRVPKVSISCSDEDSQYFTDFSRAWEVGFPPIRESFITAKPRGHVPMALRRARCFRGWRRSGVVQSDKRLVCVVSGVHWIHHSDVPRLCESHGESGSKTAGASDGRLGG